MNNLKPNNSLGIVLPIAASALFMQPCQLSKSPTSSCGLRVIHEDADSTSSLSQNVINSLTCRVVKRNVPTFGSAKGLIHMSEDFDEPLDDLFDF